MTRVVTFTQTKRRNTMKHTHEQIKQLTFDDLYDLHDNDAREFRRITRVVYDDFNVDNERYAMFRLLTNFVDDSYARIINFELYANEYVTNAIHTNDEHDTMKSDYHEIYTSDVYYSYCARDCMIYDIIENNDNVRDVLRDHIAHEFDNDMTLYNRIVNVCDSTHYNHDKHILIYALFVEYNAFYIIENIHDESTHDET